MTLVDTNVLFDLTTNDPNWLTWSLGELAKAASLGPVLINDVIYAEVSTRFARLDEVEAFLEASKIELDPMPRSALFLAGKAYKAYRAAGGTRTGVLSDFFIGAHAVATGMPLLTRDVGRYRTYFPSLTLIAPALS